MTKSRHIPLRSCIACGLKIPKGQLVRIVNTGQRSIMVDVIGREPGRGAYICSKANCWNKVFEKKVLERSFKQHLTAKDLKPVRDYYQKNIAPQGSCPKNFIDMDV